MRWVLVLVACAAGAVPAHADDRGVRLGDLSWVQAEQRFATTPIVILPFGAGAKEHGPHLPMNADQKVMDYLLDRALESTDVIVAPPILHGWFPAFRDFPGTHVADAGVFEAYVRQVGLSLVAHGAQRLVFLNTGIDKASGLPITIAAREIRVQTGTPTLVVSWGDLETEATEALQEQREGGHSDEIETSINLFLQPELVDMSRAVEDYGERPERDFRGYAPGTFSGDPADPAYSETGIYGDATLATAVKGARALEIMTREWLRTLQGFADVPTRRR